MLTVAVDTGPLYGPMTGVGRAVQSLLDEFRARCEEIDVLPYVVSRRARLEPGTRRLPYPAGIALTAWSHFDHPRPNRHLRAACVVHGTNYVVPPVRSPRLVSVYDTWALRHPDSCPPSVVRSMNVLRRSVRSGAVVHTSSQASADHLRDLFPSAEVHVVLLATPSPRLPEGDDPRDPPIGVDAPYILAVGTLDRRKNLPMLVKAFADTNAARSGVRLVLAGSPGNESEAVDSAISELDAAFRPLVRILGRVDDVQMTRLYRHAEVLAYPSLDEGFGFPILEAMSQGTPVVASSRGSIPEIAGDAAILFDPFDLEAMGSAIDQAISDDSIRVRLRQAGLSRSRTFTWQRTADGLLALYRDLSARNNADPAE